MKTDDLINVLAQDTEPKRKERLWVGIVFAAILALGFCVLSVFVAGQVRADFAQSAMPVALKFSFSALFAAAALPIASRLAQPGRSGGVWIVAAFLIGLVAVVACGMSFMPAGSGTAVSFKVVPWAFLVIPLLATPAAICVFGWYRRYAPTRLALAGASVGLLSGGLGAMAYALVCPVDDMSFVATWYGAAILACAAIGALVGPRVLRW